MNSRRGRGGKSRGFTIYDWKYQLETPVVMTILGHCGWCLMCSMELFKREIHSQKMLGHSAGQADSVKREMVNLSRVGNPSSEQRMFANTDEWPLTVSLSIYEFVQHFLLLL